MTVSEIISKIPQWIKTGIPSNVKSSNMRTLLDGIAKRMDSQETGRIRFVKAPGNTSIDLEIGDMVTAIVEDKLIVNAPYLGGNTSLLSSYEVKNYVTADEIFKKDRIISGGMRWKTGLTYESENLSYQINGEIFTIPDGTEITLDAADGTNPRIDLIFGDDTGTLGKSTGTPASSPTSNTLPSNQLQLTIALIAAGATTPTGVQKRTVFTEGAGQPAEWDATENTSGTRIDVASTTSPLTGSVSIRTIAPLNYGDVISLVHATPTLLANLAYIKFKIKNLANWGNDYITIGLYNGTSLVARHTLNTINFATYDTTNTQDITIWKYDWGISPGQTEFNTIRFFVTTRGSADIAFVIDDIEIGEDGNLVAPVEFLPTGGYAGTAQDLKNAIDNITSVNSEIIVTESSQIANQELDSSKVYVLDGAIGLADGQSIIVPAGGLTIKGFGFNVSALNATAANHTMFTSPVGGSGDLVLVDFAIATTGSNSKVFDIEDATGNHAIEIEYVNFNGCTSLGKQKGYRQGTWTTVGLYGCADGLQLSGEWNGYKVSNSNCFSFGASGTLFKKDTDTLFNNRLFLNVNVDMPTGAVLADFNDTNFSDNELFQINSSIAKLNGDIDIDNAAALVPNISANNLKSLWVGNIGLPDTATEALVENDTVTGTYQIDWLKDTYFLTLTGDTTFTETNLPASTKNTQEIKLYLTGNFVPTFPAGWTTNMVGTYKGADVNEISVKYIRNGVYFVKISNTLTVYPAPILGSVIPVSLLPDSTSELRLKGSFFTPEGFVLIDGQVVNSIEFEPDTGDYILSVTTGVPEGEFDITISNGTSVTFDGALIVNLGEVFIPTESDWTSVSGSIDITETGNALITNPTVTGSATWNRILEISGDFDLRFEPLKSPLNPNFGNFLTRNYIRLTDSGNSDVYECRLSVYSTYVQTAWTKNGTYVLNKTTTNGTTPKVIMRYDGTGLYMSINGGSFDLIASGALSGNINNVLVSLADLDIKKIKYIELP